MPLRSSSDCSSGFVAALGEKKKKRKKKSRSPLGFASSVRGRIFTSVKQCCHACWLRVTLFFECGIQESIGMRKTGDGRGWDREGDKQLTFQEASSLPHLIALASNAGGKGGNRRRRRSLASLYIFCFHKKGVVSTWCGG